MSKGPQSFCDATACTAISEILQSSLPQAYAKLYCSVLYGLFFRMDRQSKAKPYLSHSPQRPSKLNRYASISGTPSGKSEVDMSIPWLRP